MCLILSYYQYYLLKTRASCLFLTQCVHKNHLHNLAAIICVKYFVSPVCSSLFIFPSQPNSSMSSTFLHSVLLYMQPLFLFYRFQVSHFHRILLNLKDKFLLSAFQHAGLPFLHDTCNIIFCCHNRIPAVFVLHVASVTAMAPCIDFRCYNKATKRKSLAAPFGLCRSAKGNYLYGRLTLPKTV